MGNFVSLADSPTPAPSPPPRPDTSTHEPKLTPPTPPSSLRYSLTPSLTSHTRSLVRLLHRLTTSDHVRLPDVEHGLHVPDNVVPQLAQPVEPSGRPRALLIGIAYHGELLNTHQDVDRYRDVLIATYGYRPEDITVLKDDPAFADHLQPTRENILRELRSLVVDAAAGDRFTLLFSGHSNQQPSKNFSEEDFLNEYIITIDDEIIVDNELNEILIKPLPEGSSLFALFDTSHSGTLLDLPCNSGYVPLRSKGRRRTNPSQNVTVRRDAAFIQDPFVPGAAPPPPSLIASILAQIWFTVLPLFVSSVDTRVAPGIVTRHPRDYNLPSSPRFCASPSSLLPCNGWCAPDINEKAPTMVSLGDAQRTWEDYDDSFSRIVFSFLGLNQRPSYKDPMTHINFKLYAMSHQPHEWTRSEKMKLEEQAAAMTNGELCSEKPSPTETETCR